MKIKNGGLDRYETAEEEYPFIYDNENITEKQLVHANSKQYSKLVVDNFFIGDLIENQLREFDEIRVLVFLINSIQHNNVCIMDKKSFDKFLQIDYNKAKDIIKALVKANCLKVFVERDSDIVYYINPRLAWKGNFARRAVKIKDWYL